MTLPANPSFGVEVLLYTLSIGGMIGLICSFIVLSSIISKYKLFKCSHSKFIPNFTSILVVIYILSQLSFCVKQIIQIRVYFNSLDEETAYKNNTTTQDNTINILSSVQLILWHSANCILYILLSYRLWQLYKQNCSKYCIHTILISLILINIFLYMSISILFPKHADIFGENGNNLLYHQLLLTGYCLDIIICIILVFLFNKYVYLEILSESEMPYKSTLTSVLLNDSGRPSVTTLLSLPTTQSSQGTTNNASDSLNTLPISSHHTSAASTVEATIEYKVPPLSLGAMNNGCDNGHQDNTKYSINWNIIVVKHTLLTTIMVISTLITVTMFICMYYVKKILNKENKFIVYGVWFLLIEIDSCLKCVAMYLNINMTNNDKEYRKCCSKCDKCCRKFCVECGLGQTERRYNNNAGNINNGMGIRGISNNHDNNNLQMVTSQRDKNNDLYGAHN